MTADSCRSGGWLNNSSQHRNGLGFPRPIGAKQAKYLSFFNLKTDAFHSLKVTIFLHKVFHFQNISHWTPPFIMAFARKQTNKKSKFFHYPE